jgi:hypothetical protein
LVERSSGGLLLDSTSSEPNSVRSPTTAAGRVSWDRTEVTLYGGPMGTPMHLNGWSAALVGLTVVFALVVFLPSASGAVVGVPTSCTGFGDCKFNITNSHGTGFAQTYGNSLSFRLPGEHNTTTGVPYSYYPNPIYGGTYTITGSFVGADVNTGKVVWGTTAVNLTVTVHCQRGCSTTWVVNFGNITFRLTKADPTTTTVSCSPSSINPGSHTLCTVHVTDQSNALKTPNGTVKFSTQYTGVGTWSHSGTCTLLSGTCNITFAAADETSGTVIIYAHYHGNSYFWTSTGTFYLSVTSSN